MLTNATVKAAQASARPYKLADAGGLYLYVRPSGSKTWRMKYRYRRKEKLLTFGSWPETSLGDARGRRDSAREQLRNNVDPSTAKASNDNRPGDFVTFEQLARQWHERRQGRWSAEHAADVLASLERDVFPAIGAGDPRSIEAPAVLELLLAVEARGCIESARRLRERISGVFRFGIPLKLCAVDPAALITAELSPRPVQRPQPALCHLTEVVKLLSDVDALEAAAIAKMASRFLALTVVRLGTLRGAAWSEIEGIEGAAPVWRIPPGRMKLTKVRKADPAAEHLVPLSRQAVTLLLELRELTGGGELIFPGRRPGRPIGEGAIGDLYDGAGYAGRHVPHGWRASFSTILNERHPGDRDLIDQALGHSAKGKVEAAYNRSRHFQRMRDLFQCWADLLDTSP